jgi:hypothetical protein
MKRLLRILAVDSVTDLFRYKSFFFLIFFLIAADRVLRKYLGADKGKLSLGLDREWGLQLAAYVFETLPGILLEVLTDYRTLLVAAALFFLKQLISMWPSSDMRRMHRAERKGFGLIGSLLALKWQQVVWDAIAIGTVCGLVAGWSLVGFLVARLWWVAMPSVAALVLFGAAVGAAMPLGMAGFSFSSKLAVISQGSFREKLALFYRLFFSWPVLWPAYLFFVFRIVVEVIFVALIPAGAILMIDNFWLRIAIASLSATPVYSFLKMASFKFFLEVYKPFPLVREEYSAYYQTSEEGRRS